MNQPKLEILSQEIDDVVGFYRLRIDERVHYLNIQGDVYDEDTMCRPYLLIPALPRMPEGDWITMHISRSDAGELQYETNSEALPAMSTPERKETVDLLSLTVVRRYTTPRIKEVLFDGRPAIAKIACWPWEITNMSNEARAYQTLNECRQQDEESLVPDVLAYVTENHRPVGLLLEKLKGETPHLEDLSACESALKRLHRSGIVHGDVNKYNLLIDRTSNTVRMVDLEHSEQWKQETASSELESLRQTLRDESGIGFHRPW